VGGGSAVICHFSRRNQFVRGSVSVSGLPEGGDRLFLSPMEGQVEGGGVGGA